MKFGHLAPLAACRGRSPHGERGLKSRTHARAGHAGASLPSRGAWIEIWKILLSTVQSESSLPSRGAWIEILATELAHSPFLRRSPHGERGLKSFSCSARMRYPSRRSPHGERGLKYLRGNCRRPRMGRSPHGERGLKSPLQSGIRSMSMSLPSRGAWIEICRCARRRWTWAPSLPSRGAWIEIGKRRGHPAGVWSLPSRGAWIEIPPFRPPRVLPPVAPLTGSVD